jgi:hypothetical protein
LAKLVLMGGYIVWPWTTIGRGGHVSYVMQWLHGLARLGHDVLLVDEGSDDDPGLASRWRGVISRSWSLDRAVLVSGETVLCGLDVGSARQFLADADALIVLGVRTSYSLPLLERIRPRVLVDQDPGYTHMWATAATPESVYGSFDRYFTVGLNVGTPRSPLPSFGVEWHPLPPPVVLDWWGGESPGPARSVFTTVSSWGADYYEYAGRLWGPKCEELKKFSALPEKTGRQFEVALALDPEHPYCRELAALGWRVESADLVGDVDSYREYVRSSLGEFSAAQGLYVATRSGWFSDRSAAYLAAGRPVILQATGFEDALPTGKGLFAVESLEEAVDAVQAVVGDYRAHSGAALAIAHAVFDSATVCGRLLSVCGL